MKIFIESWQSYLEIRHAETLDTFFALSGLKQFQDKMIKTIVKYFGIFFKY